MAQQVEHVLGKDEVTGSNPVISSKKRQLLMSCLFFSLGFRFAQLQFHNTADLFCGVFCLYLLIYLRLRSVAFATTLLG